MVDCFLSDQTPRFLPGLQLLKSFFSRRPYNNYDYGRQGQVTVFARKFPGGSIFHLFSIICNLPVT